MYVKLKTLSVFLLLFSCALNAENKITLGVVLFPPDSVLDISTKECVGDFIEITRQVLLEYSINIDTVCAPPIRIYRFLKNGDVDFTINIKSTKAMPKNMVFTEIPFHTLNLNLYAHQSAKEQKNVAVIRGFGYHGYRDKLVGEGFKVIELPTSVASLEVFLKKRSSHLLAYQSPVNYYLHMNKVDLGEYITVTPLLDIPTYYAISGSSPHLEKLLGAFNHYATKHRLENFQQAK
jgi:hypothetical protein